MTCSTQGHLASHYQKENQLDKLPEGMAVILLVSGSVVQGYLCTLLGNQIWTMRQLWTQNRASIGQ